MKNNDYLGGKKSIDEELQKVEEIDNEEGVVNTVKTEEEIIVNKSLSHNGKYLILAKVDALKGIYDVELLDKSENNVLNTFEIVGDDHKFLWSSPTISKVCVSYRGRVWGDFCIIDVSTLTLKESPTIEEIIDHFKSKNIALHYELAQNRPDPYLTPIEWSPNSEKLLIFYEWRDEENYATQNGTFIYDIKGNDIYNFIQNEECEEGGYVEVRKPNGFTW